MEQEIRDANRTPQEAPVSSASASPADRSISAFPFKEDFFRTYELYSGGVMSRLIGCYRSPGLHAIGVYRFGNWLKKKTLLVRILLEPIHLVLFRRIRTRWGIEIDRSAQIGPGCYIGHYGGITISGQAKIGSNANISQLVTIGVSGEGEKRGVPTIGNDVYIAPGAKVFGKIRIGNNVKIGANAVIHKDIPDNAIVVLDPGFTIISFKGNRAEAR